MNRHIGVGDSKYVVIFDPLQPGHVSDVTHAHSACAMCYMAVYTGKMQAWLDIGVIGPLQSNISVTVAVTKKVSTDH